MIPEDHLRACPEHQLVSDHEDPCPACEADVGARPREGAPKTLTQEDLRWKMSTDEVLEAVQILEDDCEGPVYVTVGEIPEDELAAGYTKQEVWFNVVVAREEQPFAICNVSELRDARETYEGGEKVVPEMEDKSWILEPEEWKPVIHGYVFEEDHNDIEWEQGEDYLEMTIPFPNGDIHSSCRHEMGQLCEANGVKITTKNKAGKWEPSVIRVSL